MNQPQTVGSPPIVVSQMEPDSPCLDSVEKSAVPEEVSQ